MSDLSRPVTKLPPEQEAIRAKCFHPTETFVEFKKEEIEQSIPQRFEKIVRQYPERIAVKTKATQVISRVRETFHVQFPLRALFESDRGGVSCPNHPNSRWPLRSGNGGASGLSGIDLRRGGTALALS